VHARPYDRVPAKLRQDWGTTVITNWKIWVPFQFLNFRFVPVGPGHIFHVIDTLVS
jgi:hypothetical protein